MKDVEAVTAFRNGYNCAQSVLVPFAKEQGLPDRQAYLVASVFGGGMGKMGLTCGAVTGAFMAIGLKHGFDKADDPERRAVVLQKTKQFVDAFKKEFGALSCRELLDCDLNTEEGQKKHKDENQRELICAKCVEGAARILEPLMR